MFKPEEIIFAPTAQCNLACAHCRVSRVPGSLSARKAISFMKDCRAHGIERIGFSGGEPFLQPGFLCRVSKAAVQLDMQFDRLMTNGVWFRNKAQLARIMKSLFASGFDGKFGVSVDSYHRQDTGKLAAFFKAVFSTWGCRDCAEIISVTAPDERSRTKKLRAVARLLGGKLVMEAGNPVRIVDAGVRVGRMHAPDQSLSVKIVSMPYSVSADESAWDSGKWFKGDLCEGPGNVFYIHPDGSVAVCCGFANENKSLLIGNMKTDGYARLMRNARASAFVRTCYETGLAARRRQLQATGHAFPGRTSDQCCFCDYLSSVEQAASV